MMSKTAWLTLTAVAGLLVFGYIFTSKRVHEFRGDTPYYLAIAEQIASEPPRFRNPKSLWPNAPAMDRGPGWPFTLSLAIRLFPGGDRVFQVKSTGAVIALMNVLWIALLTFNLTRSNAFALCAGLAWAANPHTLALIEDGATEPLFVFLTALGLVAMHRGRGGVYGGAFFLGLSCLVRQFFVIFPFGLLAVCLLVHPWRHPRGPLWWRRLLIAGLLFLMPAAVWCYRNYKVCGRAPVLSTLRGETFYGANNPVVANQLETWGYWIMPDEIPGEVKKRRLSLTLTEAETDRYYFQKGLSHVRAHWFELPRHLLGKLIRGYVPIPWAPSWSSHAVFSYRWALYIAFAITLNAALQSCPQPYPKLLAAMWFTSVTVTLIFYGAARFTYCFEPFLIPFIAKGVQSMSTAAPSKPLVT